MQNITPLAQIEELLATLKAEAASFLEKNPSIAPKTVQPGQNLEEAAWLNSLDTESPVTYLQVGEHKSHSGSL